MKLKFAVHFIDMKGTDGVTAVLIKNGAGVNLVDKDGNTPLNLAIQFGI